ncbi:AAA family ATPase [Patescibacteria group bacterium]|nr:AAA family ATPase [Patescibacteria group bacterium]
MYLSKLEIQGFKSFAEKTVLEFNRELTAIVGPNGSGKSNVADSVRWVLGEQSLKLLRGKKSEDVIFAGSKRKSRLGYAEVSLYLNNQDGRAPIDYREIVITRRIYRSGESEYLINKNKVRLTDIQLLLAKSNFGQKTYSIIGQGMIDSILTSSAQERKEFFDEATGVRQYQIKRDQALNKLEHSQENLAQSHGVLNEIAPRLRSLTRQVKKLERKEEISKALNQLQTQYYSRLLHDLNKEESKLNQQQKNLESEKNKLEVVITEGQKKIENLQVQDTEAGAFQKLQDEYSNLSRQKNQLLQELTLVKGKLDLELVKLGKTNLVWAQKKKEEIVNQKSIIRNRIAENNSLIEKIKKQLDHKTQEQQKILAEYQNLQDQLLKAQKSLSGNDQFSLVKIQSHLTSLYQKQQEFLEFLGKVKDASQLNKLKIWAEEISKEIKWLLNKLESRGGNESEDLIKIQEKLNWFLTSKDSLVNEIQELKIKLEIGKQKNQQLLEQGEKLGEEEKKIELELGPMGDQGSNNQDLHQQKEKLETGVKKLDDELKDLQKGLEDFSKDQEHEKKQLFTMQRSMRDLQVELNGLNNDHNEVKIALAKIETRKEDLEKEIAAEMSRDFNPLEEKIEINLGETFAEIGRLKNNLAVIGGIDEEVVKEYNEVKERHDFLNEQITDLESAIISCHNIIEELDEKIKIQFEEAFEKINKQFGNYFKILFNGGAAKLLLQKREIKEQLEEALVSNGQESEEEPQNIKEKGGAARGRKYEIVIEIQASPPGKRLKSLNMLSGGEKALTSIALICAIIANNPSPFVILDEVDAALDEANSERFVKIVDELSDSTQFICITHNRMTMHHAAILYGITMSNDGVSKLLSINLQEAEKVAE